MKKFKELSGDEMAVIVKALGNGEVVQVYARTLVMWVPLRNDTLNPELCYHIAPIKPEVNWDHINPEINHFCRDENDKWFVYEQNPTRGARMWSPSSGGDSKQFDPKLFASFKPGNCDWKDSKISRGDK